LLLTSDLLIGICRSFHKVHMGGWNVSGYDGGNMRKVRYLALCLALLAADAGALPERVGSIDLMSGLPQLMALEAQVVLWKHWQVGFGYGYIPGLGQALGAGIKLNSQKITIPGGSIYNLVPTASYNLSTLSPFIRFFPRDDNFYIQITYAFIRATADVTADLQPVSTTVPVTGTVNGSITVLQAVPTLSVGNLWMSKAFFFNLSLGASFFFTTSASVSLAGVIPDASGSSASNQAALNAAESQMQNSIVQSVQTAKNQVFLIPSINLAVGIVL